LAFLGFEKGFKKDVKALGAKVVSISVFISS
jgi:hypothetical protein